MTGNSSWALHNPDPAVTIGTMDMSQHLKEYKRLRTTSLKIGNRLTELAGKDFGAAAKTFGMLDKDGRHIDLETEDELALLAEYAIFDILHDGKNAVDEMLASEPPADGSDEMLILQAMKRARYTILAVKEALPGAGIIAEDLFHEEEVLLMDVGISKTVPVGAGLAGRIYSPLGTWWMTTGTGLPVDPEAGKKVSDRVQARGGLSHFKQGELSATIIRACRAAGASHRIAYTDMGEMPSGRAAGNIVAQRKIGRNEPCPCGSGKKYKKCCGA
jgi:hypothetical protein